MGYAEAGCTDLGSDDGGTEGTEVRMGLHDRCGDFSVESCEDSPTGLVDGDSGIDSISPNKELCCLESNVVYSHTQEYKVPVL